MPPSRADNPTYGRKQPGWVYTTAELPALPPSTPVWLAEVVTGLVKSDHSEAERRLSPRQAISMLEVEVRSTYFTAIGGLTAPYAKLCIHWWQGVARAWSQLEDARAQLVVLQQQVAFDRFSHSHQSQQRGTAVDADRAVDMSDPTTQIRLVSEQLQAAQVVAQTAKRQADQLRAERETATTELLKERTKLQASLDAQENEKQVHLEAISCVVAGNV